MTSPHRYLFLVALLLGGLALSAALSVAGAAQLRSAVEVSGELITLGDIFTGAGNAENTVVARSPAPGTSAALSVSKISQIARRHAVRWRNNADLTRIIVKRTGDPVPEPVITSALTEEITRHALSLSARAQLHIEFDVKSARIHVAEGEEPTVKVERLAFDKRTGRFQALLRAPANNPAVPLRKVQGRVYPVIEIPVLTRQIPKGEIIRDRDIEWIKLPAEQLSRNFVTASTDLVGLSPRRAIRMGQPVRSSDVEPPVLVEKGTLVSVVYNAPNMKLTTKGRALQNGALGETIDILNPASHRTIQGVITGPNEIHIGPTPSAIIAAAS